MKYTEFRKKESELYAKLPIKYAFGKEQFQQMLREFGLDVDDENSLSQLAHIYSGAYCLKKDKQQVFDYFEEAAKRKEEFLKDEAQLKDALIYEFGNHECGYTYNFMEGVSALFDEDEIENNMLLAKVYPIARKEYLEKYEM